MVTAETLPSGARLVTESMPHVRSVTVGVWLTRGSRHEADGESGVAHFVEHMLFKGTTSRSARDIAQTVDGVGGQIDAFTAKEYAGYYIKVLDQHLPTAIEILGDMILRPALAPADVEREQSVILEEIKMAEDSPDDLVHEAFTQQFWSAHPLGRPILGTPTTVGSFTADRLREYFTRTYVAPNVLIVAAGNAEHAQVAALVERFFADLPPASAPPSVDPPEVTPGIVQRSKAIEQSHICIGTPGYPLTHANRHATYVLNTILGGSMSSRLFQHIREDRGLAYAVYSNLTAYSDAGMFAVYAGCATDKVSEVIGVTLNELRTLQESAVGTEELSRAKEHLKGNLMLGLEHTSSRMTNLARQHIYFGRHFSMDEVLAEIDRVTAADVQRVAGELFRDGAVVASVVGPEAGVAVSREELGLSA